MPALLFLSCCGALPTAAHGREGTTLHVSKLGDNSDGLSWETAFRTVQAALNAVPDAEGGHRIIVRPDTYFEAMLFPAQKGAAGAYNQLIGDIDGSLGSGTTGRVVIDSGDPEQRGFKSYDWWGPVKSYSQGWSPEHTEPTFSAIGWDRWHLRNLYVAGGDGGLMFDLTDQVKPFTVIVEDCVSIGRAFGGGVASCLSRPDEPITFRRCHLWALDWWGDTAAAYVRVENKAMPDRPDVVFEDCTMVSPQCALKGNNYGFHTYARVKLTRCRLVALNFSQPHGTPTDGIIQSVQEGKLLHVDLEDCTLMGYKVFGVTVNKDTAGDIGYSVTGDVKTYVQFQQEVPEGFLRLGHWPAEAFDAIAPPPPPEPEPRLRREGVVRPNLCEVTPVVWEGRLCLVESIRPGRGGELKDYYVRLTDADTGDELARLAEGHGLACAYVHGGGLYVFASRYEPDGPWSDVTLFASSDLRSWDSQVVTEQDPGEHLFNSSVCEGPEGFVMAYETNDPAYPPFSIKFARSDDLLSWTKVPGVVFGTDRYTACPCIRYVDGYYYMLYLEHRTPRWFFETYIARSRHLKTWEISPANPVLTPTGLDEGINASDPDIIELDGNTHIYYAVGDQRTWANVKRATFKGGMGELFGAYFPR
jgi:hypothetical protein